MEPDRRHEGRVSGPRWNRLVDRWVERYWDRVEFFVELFLQDGYPPFTEPLPPREQYNRLVAWRAAGDPRFWEDREAQAALAELSARYGQPPPISPLSQQVPPRL